jgi:soluble lytic murein transglycosylase-like protein
MRHLHRISVSAYRRTAARRACWKAVRRAVSWRRAGLGAVAALLVVVPENPVWQATEPGLTFAATSEATIASRPVPRMVATTAAGGPASAYASRDFAAYGALSALAIQPAALTLEDVWSKAFFGDKDRLAAFIEHTAAVNDLPVEFLMRLLRQESGLNYRAVSPAGALGIAQFMPGTAGERGLADPFNPYEAIPKSAELLRAYRTQFGNLGFAAAAYNAGPQRVRNWLSGRSTLPRETREYVATITGRNAEEWRQGGDLYAWAEVRYDPPRY